MSHLDVLKHFRPAAALVPALLMLLAATPAEAQDKYKVVINHEEQYSIWPAERESPSGWRQVGEHCTLEDCHAYIEEVWTDMRPLSLRQGMKALRIPRDAAAYRVVINHEEQYSIWMHNQELMDRWRETGQKCSWKACMAYIEEVWTDMRPLSVRKQMEEMGREE